MAQNAEMIALLNSVRSQTNMASSTEMLVTGMNRLLQNAVDQALKAGATPTQLSPITGLSTALHQQIIPLSTALVTNVTLPDPRSGRK